MICLLRGQIILKLTNMIQEENFNEQESLALIESMIKKAKNQFSENGHSYLLWGWLVLICSIAQFILLNFVHYEKHYLVWMLTWVAVIYQIFYQSRRKKNEKVKTYTDEIIGYVWITFVISMMIIGFNLGSHKLADSGIWYSVILALYGMPTFLSGIILRFPPLVVGGICCWILSVVSVFVPYEYQMFLLSIAMIVAWIIPGYKLRARYKASNSNSIA